MQLESLHRGVRRQDVKENTAFELAIAAEVKHTDPPTAEELYVLRNEVDPEKIIIGR